MSFLPHKTDTVLLVYSDTVKDRDLTPIFHMETTGDIFRDEPREDMILDQLAERFPAEYDKLVQEWKAENGHL
jgi:hypothetical protein